MRLSCTPARRTRVGLVVRAASIHVGTRRCFPRVSAEIRIGVRALRLGAFPPSALREDTDQYGIKAPPAEAAPASVGGLRCVLGSKSRKAVFASNRFAPGKNGYRNQKLDDQAPPECLTVCCVLRRSGLPPIRLPTLTPLAPCKSLYSLLIPTEDWGQCWSSEGVNVRSRNT